MKQQPLLIILISVFFACNTNPEKERGTNLLKEKIGGELRFKDVKIASVEKGTAVIIDKSWCYWIDTNGKVYCVNGTSKSAYNANNSQKCEDAPIKASFSDIEKIAK